MTRQPPSSVSFCSAAPEKLRRRGCLTQGFGGPCCARILTSWFATKERGTYWGMWNIAHNLGGFSAPLLAGSAARSLGWKWGDSPPCVLLQDCTHVTVCWPATCCKNAVLTLCAQGYCFWLAGRP